MLQNEPIILFRDGDSERDYTWIDDVMAGTLAAIDRTRTTPGEFEIINVGGSRTTSLRRLIELIGNALDVEARIERHPTQPGDVTRTCADVAVAQRLLGYCPTTPVEEGIPQFVEWLKDERRKLSSESSQLQS